MKLSKESGTWLQLISLIFYSHCSSVCISIRYGFLEDAFARKGVDQKMSGAVGTSIFIGFGLTYIFQLVERLMKRFCSRHILVVTGLGWTVIAAISALSYQIEDINTFIAISFVMRILQGFLAYICTILPIDYLNANYAKDFEFTCGLVNVGYFTGHGVSEVLGCVLYERFGYEAAYGFTACVGLMATLSVSIVLPNTKTHLATQADVEEKMSRTKQKMYGTQGLSKFLIPTTVAAMLCNANYGVIQVTVTPFLKEQFNKSISYGGTVLTFVSLGMALGSFSVGSLLQKKIMSHFTAMAIGAFCIGMGLLMTFPSERIPWIYDLAPILAYPGVFIAGFGDPLITIAALNADYYVQRRTKGEMQPKTITKITGIWLITYCSMYFSGSFIGETMTDYFSHSTTAEILAGICLLAMTICLGLRFYFGGSEDEEKEKESLIVKA